MNVLYKYVIVNISLKNHCAPFIRLFVKSCVKNILSDLQMFWNGAFSLYLHLFVDKFQSAINDRARVYATAHLHAVTYTKGPKSSRG